ncbi:unnamed protein product [Peronospora destructor]|uniref:RING-type domain-containing protein n=1 Tax=Peronospora destructor TaxID=86335 RepID=A0AAV0UNY6_9STRA|nr:unnamed protein product [Peronospora destructor]
MADISEFLQRLLPRPVQCLHTFCHRGFYLHTSSCTCPICDVNLGAKPSLKSTCQITVQLKKRKSKSSTRTLVSSANNLIRRLRIARFELYPQRGPDVPLFLHLSELKAPCMNTLSFFKIMYLRKYLAKKLNILRGDRDFMQRRGCRSRILTRVHPTNTLERGLQDDSLGLTPESCLLD